MHKATFLSLASIALLTLGITSCSNNIDDIQLATGSANLSNTTETAKAYNHARKLESQGKISKAIKAYGRIAGETPQSAEAPQSRLREADLLYNRGSLISSFDKYQFFITQYRGTSDYSKAIARQAEIAHAAADGSITNSFLGLKSKIPRIKAAKMLKQVRDNAPFGKTAPKAQFATATMWQNDKNYSKAIAAYEDLYVKYPNSSLAPEALFRVGSLLLKQTKDGNRNSGNLDTANTTFTDLTSLYPNSSQAKKSKKILKEIKNSDIQRSFDIAEFYEKKKQHTSAAFYYNEVIDKTKSGSDLNNQAKLRLAAISK